MYYFEVARQQAKLALTRLTTPHTIVHPKQQKTTKDKPVELFWGGIIAIL